MNLSEGFPGGSEVKASAYNVGDLGSIPGLGRSPGEGNSNSLQAFPTQYYLQPESQVSPGQGADPQAS